MIADCITTGVPLAALNNDFIQQCRTRLAHCLLQNKVTPFTQNNIGVRLRHNPIPPDTRPESNSEETKAEEEDHFPWEKYISEHDDPETEHLAALNAAAYPHLLSPDYVGSL